MKKGTDIVVSLIIIILILTGIAIYKGNFRPFSTSSEWKYEKVVIRNENDYNQNSDVIRLKDGCWRMYTHGWRVGVEENNIYSFHSCDGLNWEFEGMRLQDASMPASTILDDGRTRLYFTWSPRDGRPFRALISAISDDGLNFTIDENHYLVTGEGELKDIKAVAHFELLKLDKGYRMYFDEGGVQADDLERYKDTGWKWPVQRVRSVYSEDGLNWKLEPDARIEIEQEPLIYMQRASVGGVFKTDDGYKMYFGAGFSPWEDLKPTKRWEWSGIYTATSKDGLNFKILDKRIMKCNDAKIVKANEDTLRVYCAANPWLSGTRIGMRIYRAVLGKKENNFIYSMTKHGTL